MKKLFTLTPFAAFITIVGVILVPLSRFGGVYAWPCGRIALTVCLFYLGCLIAEWLKGKLSRGWLIGLGIAAAICFEQKYLFESAIHYHPYDHIYWYHRYFSSLDWLIYYLSFMLLGVIVNSSHPVPLRQLADDGSEDEMILTYLHQRNNLFRSVYGYEHSALCHRILYNCIQEPDTGDPSLVCHSMGGYVDICIPMRHVRKDISPGAGAAETHNVHSRPLLRCNHPDTDELCKFWESPRSIYSLPHHGIHPKRPLEILHQTPLRTI